MATQRLGQAVVIGAVMIFGLTYGLSAPLISLRLHTEGYDEWFIGLNAAMHAVGVFAVAPFLPALCQRSTPGALITRSLFAILVLLCLFPFVPLLGWFALRFLLGVFSEIILVVTETWLNHTTVEQARAKTLAWYTASLSLGYAIGPLLLLIAPGDIPFYLGGGLALLSAVVLWTSAPPSPPLAEEKVSGILRYIWMAPLAMAATALNAALEAAGLNLLVVYAMQMGWSEQAATELLAVLMVGAIVLQLPVGWLADKYDRHKLLLACAALSTIGALLWPLALNVPLLAWLLMFFWGGVFVAIYTLIITQVGSRWTGSHLAGVYAAMSIMWGVGALIGPSLGGIAMSAFTHGLPYLAALLCGLFFLWALWIDRRGNGGDAPHRAA